MPRKRVPLSSKVTTRFADFRAELDAAASPFTGGDTFAVSPETLNLLPEARREADQLLKQHPHSPVSHSFVLTGPGSYAHEMRW